MKSTSPAKLTYEDLLRSPDDGLRHELIDGEHYVTPSPNLPHQRLVGRLFLAIHDCLTRTGQGEVLLSPLDVVLSDHDVVEPDLLVVLRDQTEILTPQHVRGAPAVVIEVLSAGTKRRDETIKWHLYDRVGVREYWLVDPDAASATVWARTEAGQQWSKSESMASRGDVMASEAVTDFRLSVADLFGSASH
ncbi:MAG TPA: Uma2 family endonuclease [Vicinamibacterales bacterium]|nr:Uma2 family endonuclease [Vicinamibacterales bacterium]